MPQNDVFTFEVLVGDVAVREYVKDGQTYIMTDLMHATTYYEDLVDFIDGEEERQKVPVTPYTISVTLTSPKLAEGIAVIYIDGVEVNNIVLFRHETRTVKGFQDGTKTREFLFSLPRFSFDQDDRIKRDRLDRVGVIEVVMHETKMSQTVLKKDNDSKRAKLAYDQATKKDAKEVTKGKHTMATSKPGRFIEGENKKTNSNASDKVTLYNRRKEYSRQNCMYRMKHTLAEMGIEI